MNVAGILKEKGRQVETAGLDDTLIDIAKTMIAKHIGSVVVLNPDRSVAGVIAERDIVQLVAEQGAMALSQPVSQCLQCLDREVPVCRESDSLVDLMNDMTRMRARHLPVVERGEVVGLVSIGDVVKARIAETEREAHAMRRYIVSG